MVAGRFFFCAFVTELSGDVFDVFVGPHAAGNSALVVHTSSVLSFQRREHITAHSGSVCCFAAPLEASSTHPLVYRVDCHNAHGQIACCGHGLLATAARLFDGINTDHTLTLHVGDSLVSAYRGDNPSGASYGLRFGRIRSEVVVKPEWMPSVVNAPILKVAAYKGDTGYWVVQVGGDLASLQPDLHRLTKHSQRALILTQIAADAEDCESTSPSNIAPKHRAKLRYFAPQYGTPEDGATGSAVRILADFWADEWAPISDGQPLAVEFRQCSKTGGLMSARVHQDHVGVEGVVKRRGKAL